MQRVALTGNVASGKTAVADRWRKAGVRVIDADAIGHAVLAEDGGVQEALVKEFGGGILDYDERIDRARLGEKAFASPEKTKRLNDIVHPPLLERLDEELAAAESDGEPLVVVDAALVFEFHLDEVLDEVVLVAAPRRIRAERLRRERGLSDEMIEAIMSSQLSDTDKMDESDYVIVNDGSLEELYARSDAVLAAIRRQVDSDPGVAQANEEE